MPLSGQLEYPNIYLTIHLRPGFRPIRFHWTLFIPHPPRIDPRTGQARITTGVKIHVVDLAHEPYWAYEADWNFNLADCLSVGAAVVIGRLREPWTVAEIDRILSTLPLNVIPDVDAHRETRFCCRVWIREAVRMLNWQGVIRCDDVNELEYEVFAYGERVIMFAENGLFRGAQIHHSRFSY